MGILDKPVTLAGIGAAPLLAANLYPGRKAGFLGDSHTAGVGTTNTNYAFPRQSMHHAGTFNVSLSQSVVAGVGGETSGQVAARLDALLAQGIELLVLECGANDANGSLPVTTYAANIIAMVNKAKAKGVAVVVVNVPPKETNTPSVATFRPFIDNYNSWLATWCPRNGVVLADIWSVLADPVTGDVRTEYGHVPTNHMNNLGHYQIAVVVGQAIKRALKAQAAPAAIQRPSNLCGNGFMAGASGTVPTGWALLSGALGATAPVHSMIADDTGLLPGGKWWQIDVDNTAGVDNYDKTHYYAIGGSPYAVNDLVAVYGHLVVEDMDGTSWVNGLINTPSTMNNSLGLRYNATNVLTLDNAIGIPIGGNKYYLGPVLLSINATSTTVPSVRWRNMVPMGKRLKFRLGAVEVLNLTRMGLSTSLG